MKTFALIALALLAAPLAHALEHCTRALVGDGPELGPTVCTEVTSDRGVTVAIRAAHEIRSPSQTSAEPAPQHVAPPVGSIASMDKEGFTRHGTPAGDPRQYCGDDVACQQWYVENAYVAQNGDVRLKQPWLYRATQRGYNAKYHPNIVLHRAR